MKIYFLVILSLFFVACAQQEKSSDSITDKKKWQNVDNELKKGAKKTKGLLERAGILSKDNPNAEEKDEKKDEEKKSDNGSPSSRVDSKSIWNSVQRSMNNGWNKVVGFVDGIVDSQSTSKEE